MEQTLKNSMEAAPVLEEVYKELRCIPYNRDLNKFYENLHNSLVKINQLEVYVRRTHKRSRYAIQHKKEMQTLNEGIKFLRNYILMARIMA